MADDEESFGNLDQATGQLSNLTNLSRQFEKVVMTAFRTGTSQVRSFESALRSAALQLSSMVLKQSFRALIGSAGDATKSLFGNLFGGESPASQSQVDGFAQGGIFASPRYFPTGNGLGVLGEAGPEAVMPLSRGADGRLGVRMAGSEGVVTVNIATPDAPSFLRSEAQISAALARAVARGRRGL